MATFMGIGPVILASALGALVWNFFFIPPHYTFHISKVEDILMFGVFFSIAMLNGVLTTRVRQQEKLAREREKHTNALFQLTKELSKTGGIDEVLSIAIKQTSDHFSFVPLFILQDGKNILSTSGRLQKEKHLSQSEYEIAEWVFKNIKKAGAYTNVFSSVHYTFFPLQGTRVIPGVAVVKLEKPFPTVKQEFWDTFVALISNALEREFLAEIAQKARFLDESGRLYKTLFNSISHELRIPIATIMGAADSLLNSIHSENVQMMLYNEISTATIRLNRLIENLLNMSRLESGHISVRLDWYDIYDLVNKVANDLKDELKPYNLLVSIPDSMPLVKIDFGLVDQVLYNLLFNATQHAPVATDIELNVSYDQGCLNMQISDKGPGFPVDMLPNLYKKFFRVDGSKTGGLGLGLSIVKGFIEAHKGNVTVENCIDRGARFTIKIPSENQQIENLNLDDNE